MNRLRRLLPTGMAGLTGLACFLCCAVPFLIGMGLVGGTAWTAFGTLLPGLALIFAALTGGAWWWSRGRRHADGCPDSGTGCDCAHGTAS